MRQLINSRQHRLDNLFGEYKTLPIPRTELRSNWSRYLCVLVSGFLEVSVRHIYTSYAEDKSDPKTAKYVYSKLKRFTSPKMKNIIRLTAMFDQAWADDLKDLTDEKLKYSVDSIVANRHQIVHGENNNISYSRIKDYYEDAKEVIEILIGQCGD